MVVKNVTDNLAFDLFILVLRIAFIFLLYFFLFLVVRTITRELNTPLRRSRPITPEMSYAPDNYGRPEPPRNGPVGRLVVTEIGSATTVKPGVGFELGPIMPIGRGRNNAIILDDDFVSTEHALLSWRDGRWWLSDVASTNGTFLNGQQITTPVQVNWGDLLGIGRVRLRLEP